MYASVSTTLHDNPQANQEIHLYPYLYNLVYNLPLPPNPLHHYPYVTSTLLSSYQSVKYKRSSKCAPVIRSIQLEREIHSIKQATLLNSDT
jgi:hypothetical protein